MQGGLFSKVAFSQGKRPLGIPSSVKTGIGILQEME
jgi:hypothetical protein